MADTRNFRKETKPLGMSVHYRSFRGFLILNKMKKLVNEMKVVSQVADVRAVYSTKIPAKDRVKVISSQMAYKALLPYYTDGIMEQKEVFCALYLDKANKMLGTAKITEGSVSSCIVDVPYIFRLAILMNASSIILCHNHPSGNLQESDADKIITKKIIQAGELLDIKILDHLIIHEENYHSFADNGLI